MKRISPQAVVAAVAGQLTSDLAEQAMILELTRGDYYELDAVAAGIWRRLQQPHTVEDICRWVAAEYDVPEDQSRDDVLAFLAELESAGLVEIKNEPVQEIR